MRVIWSPLAVEQTRDIASYIALDKPTVAEQWVDGIFSSIDRLIEFPQSGRVVPELQRSEIREIVQGNYRVIYRVKDAHILVLLVKNYRQKLKESEVQP